MILGRAAGRVDLTRDVQPTGGPIASKVLPEIRELQRGAQRVGRSIEVFASIAGNAQHQAADRVGGSAAVVEQLAPRVVPSRHGILAERADEIVEQDQRQIELPNGVRDGPDDEATEIVGRPGGRLFDRDRCMQALLPGAEVFEPFGGRGRAFVCDVVRHARKRIHRGHVWTHGRRQQSRGHWKILVVRSCERSARAVGTLERTGRDGHLQMIRDVFAGVIAAGLLFLAARLATTLRSYRRAQQRTREREEALGRTVIAEIPSEDNLLLFTEDAGRFYYGGRAIDKDQIVSAQLLINGVAVGQVGQEGRDREERQDGLERPEEGGIPRDRWDVRIDAGSGVTVVACGAIRERVSQELARAVFDAVKRTIAGGDHHSVSGAPPR